MRFRGSELALERTQKLLIGIVALALPLSAQTAKPAAGRPDRTVMVSVADRKLAVIEEGNVIATFPVAVGATVSSSPTGKFQIVSRVANPTY